MNGGNSVDLRKGEEIQKTFRKNTVGKAEEIQVGRKLNMSVNVYTMCGGVSTLGMAVRCLLLPRSFAQGGVRQVSCRHWLQNETFAFTVAFTDH